MLAFWQSALVTDAGTTLQGQRLGYGPDEASHWHRDRGSICGHWILFPWYGQLSSPFLPCVPSCSSPLPFNRGFNHLFINLCLSPCSVLTLGIDFISWFLCMHVTYDVCIQMSPLHSLAGLPCVSLWGVLMLSVGRIIPHWHSEWKIDTFFIPLIGNNWNPDTSCVIPFNFFPCCPTSRVFLFYHFTLSFGLCNNCW